MLSADQVQPFLFHRLRRVRRFAAQYFALASDPSILDADVVFAAMDRCEDEDDGIPWFPTWARQSEKSLDRVTRYIIEEELKWGPRARGSDHVALRYVQAVQDRLPRQAGLAHLRARLRHRLAVASDPSPTIHRRLVELCESLRFENSENVADEELLPYAEALAADLAAATTAVTELSARAQPHEMWFRYAAARVAGFARCEPAVPLLIDLLASEEDIVGEQANRALSAIDAETTVTHLRAAYARAPGLLRCFSGSILGRFRRPSAEDLLIELIGLEEHMAWRSFHVSALIDMCTTKGLPWLLTMRPHLDYDPGFIIEGDVTMLAMMQAGDPWERAALERSIEQVERGRQADVS